MMFAPFTPEILAQHLAVLGKTGSGKTSTAKLLIEQVAGAGARVCILDPLKSDWWGLTSSRDGRAPGLPFHILGGPRGHVPLHAGAGTAIAGVIASGAVAAQTRAVEALAARPVMIEWPEYRGRVLGMGVTLRPAVP